MRERICLALAFGLVLLTIIMPDWPIALFLWFRCPNTNPLSPSCGDITLGFGVRRIGQAAFVIGLVACVVRVIRRIGTKEKS
jgi:hypothetical protein